MLYYNVEMLFSITVNSPISPNKLSVHKANATAYSKARHSLHTQLTDEIIGRDEEITALRGFIEPALRAKTGVSLYISGKLSAIT